MYRSGRGGLGEQDDLTGVHGEVLDDVIDRGLDICVAILNRALPQQIILGQTRNHTIRFTKDTFEIFEECVAIRPVTRREFRGTIAFDPLAADASYNPLPDIARQVEKKIADAVRSFVSAPPESVFWKRGNALSDLGGILLREIVA
jgi:hypothetical protein